MEKRERRFFLVVIDFKEARDKERLLERTAFVLVELFVSWEN